MPNIIDILARALSLRQETALNSITPNRAGGIMYDTLLVLNQMQLEGGSLLISKVYASVSAMEADTTPTSDLTGRALKPGQLVVIVTSDTSSTDMGSEYRYNGPGSWTYVGKVGGLPLDTVPTQSSTKGITSGGVYTALAAIKAEGYKYMGIASPGSGGTTPNTPNQPVFYIAGPGSYPNFGSITVASGYLGFIKYSSGSWIVESVAVGKDYDQEISQLQQEVTDLTDPDYEGTGTREIEKAEYLDGVTRTVNGVSIVCNADGTFEFSGTATSGGGRGTKLTSVFTLPAGTYTLRATTISGSVLPSIYLNKNDGSDTIIKSFSNSGEVAVTIANDTPAFIGAVVTNGTAYSGKCRLEVISIETYTKKTAEDDVARGQIRDLVYQPQEADETIEKYVDSSGNLQDSASWKSLVFKGEFFNKIRALSFSSLGATYADYYRVAFYNSDITQSSATIIGGVRFSNVQSGKVAEATIPTGTKCIIVSSRAADGEPSATFVINDSVVVANKNAIEQVAILSALQFKRLSIIGDSISTYDKDGFKLPGYRMYYPYGNVKDVRNTYWKKLADVVGASIEVNASWSGSCATDIKKETLYDGTPYPDFYDRCSLLGTPDAIIVELGQNDSNSNVALGDYDYDSPIAELSESLFRPAYIKGIRSLLSLYPNAKIICVATEMGGTYKASIKEIALHYGLGFVDVSGYDQETMTAGHPSSYGMVQIASKLANLSDNETESSEFIVDNETSIDDVRHNYINYETGELISSPSWDAYFVKVTPREKVRAKIGINLTTWAAVAYYNSENPSSATYIGGVQGISGTNTYNSIVPDNAVLAIVCNRVATEGNPQISFYFDSIAPIVDALLDVQGKVNELTGNVEKVFSSFGHSVGQVVDDVYSDMTWVGDKLVCFNSSNDDLQTEPERIAVYTFGNGKDKPYTDKNFGYHTLGHCNTIDYCEETDCLILGNGSGSYNLSGKIIIIPEFSSLIGNVYSDYPSTNPLGITNSGAIVIDCASYNLGTKFNVLWGENNGLKYNIAYLITAKTGGSTSDPAGGDNGTIRRIVLGMGSNSLQYGQFISGKADDEFNGTFAITDTYTQPETNYTNGCNQGTCYHKGRIISAVNHDGLNIWAMRLDDGEIYRNVYNQKTFGADGTETKNNISGICVKDGRMYVGGMSLGILCYDGIVD